MLAFSSDDKLLISCGLTQNSACIIYDWMTKEIMISTALSSPSQEIFVLPEISRTSADFNLNSKKRSVVAPLAVEEEEKENDNDDD